MNETMIPVYFVNGFLESGKTTFIRGLLGDPDFTQGHRILLVRCEDGEEEYSEEFLQKNNVALADVDSIDAFEADNLRALSDEAGAAAVFVECNGMWDSRKMIFSFPEAWRLIMVITLVDAGTYELYSANMGNFMFSHISQADAIMINRCTDELKEMLYRRNLIAMNPKASIELVDPDGNTEDYVLNLPVPYDLDAETVDILPEHFGIWYIDALRSPSRYDGKKIRVTGEVRRGEGLCRVGRLSMVCCAEDMTFYGAVCRGAEADKWQEGDWVTAAGTVRIEQLPVYHGEGPVLLVTEWEAAEPPEDKVLYLV